MADCDTDEILRQIKLIGELKQLRENMSDLLIDNPDLINIDNRLSEIISTHETILMDTVQICGMELPVETAPWETEVIPIMEGANGP